MKKWWFLLFVLLMFVFGCSREKPVLLDLQVVACESASDNGNCGRLADLGLVSGGECCSALGRCCGSFLTGRVVQDLSDVEVAVCQYASENDNCVKLADLGVVSEEECCSALGLCCSGVSLDDFKSVLIKAIKAYFTSNPTLGTAELKDLIVVYFSGDFYFSSSGVVDLSGVGFFSGERLVDVYNKAKGVVPPIETCYDECTSGAKKCYSTTAYQVCGNYDSDSCLEWGTITSCASGQTCSNGQCSTSCTNECSSNGLKQCVSSTSYKTCGNFDSDICLEWSSIINCTSGQTCSNGQCIISTANWCEGSDHDLEKAGRQGICCNSGECDFTKGRRYMKTGNTIDEYDNGCSTPTQVRWCCTACLGGSTCTDECGAGSKQCSGNAYQTCANYDSDSCLEWGTAINCPSGQTCSNGQCSTSCTNECSPSGLKQCVSSTSYKTCGNYDSDICLEWSSIINCGAGQTCSNGVCVGVCVPSTCSSLGKQCDYWSDGCGGTLNCGTCPSGQVCNSNGQCVTTCTPYTCSGLGRQCGTVSDGCSGTLSCGTCPSGKTCTNGQCVIISPGETSTINRNQGVGQCHWIKPEIISRDYISWAYDTGEGTWWKNIQKTETTFDFSILDQTLARVPNNKRVWIEVHMDGMIPQWAKDKGLRYVPSTRGDQPVYWDPLYKNMLRKIIHKAAERYDDNPMIDAVNVAAGCYGEMNLMKCGSEEAWVAAGYTNEVYAQAVKDIIDIYLEKEYTWPDGTKTHGFLKKPVVLQLGSGLYGQRIAVAHPVVDYAISKYGMRVWLKYNGWGGGYEPGEIFRKHWTNTRVGYEPAGNVQGFPRASDLEMALGEHSSYVCFQEPYLEDQSIIPKVKDLATKIGSQIMIQDFNYPSSANSGGSIQLTFKWKNLGVTPLMRPQRVGIKDVVASYDIFVDFVSSSGQTVFHYQFTPLTPTYLWYQNKEIVETKTLTVPSIQPGQYSVRIGIVNPDNENEKIILLNKELRDEYNRYKMGLINIGV